MVLGIMGMREPKSRGPEEILALGEQYGIPRSDSYEMDSSYYSIVEQLDTTRFKQDQKNLLQPLQVLYFDASGTLISYHVNCSVGGFPNLKWNRFGDFNQFPAAKSVELDTMTQLNNHLLHVNPLNNAPFPDLRTYDYTVLVYWTGFMGRQSKRLVRVVKKNVRLAKDKKVMVIYVNSDNFWAKAELNIKR
ncbi:MAG: hypothetical protein RL632_860 [Bacteroidota bacterium]|jgi:hypothetical protein